MHVAVLRCNVHTGYVLYRALVLGVGMQQNGLPPQKWSSYQLFVLKLSL